MSDQLLSSPDVRILTDLGFMSVSRGLLIHAAAIFEGVKAARPQQEAGFIGMALVYIAAGDYEKAISTLKPLPPSDETRAFLGLAYLKQGDKEQGVKILQDVANTATTSSVAEMAHHFLTLNS